jgi:phage/plasmid-like protein (TIGR03299 family)
MAHEINIVNGKAAFMSLRQSAWHGLGQVIDRPVTSDEAIKLSGLDWTADKQGLYRSDMDPITSHEAIVRSDTGQTLGIVGANFTPVQNRELFDWFVGLDGFADVTFETAGALGQGETAWVLARCNGLKFDIGGDAYQGYMAMINGHTGNRKLTLMPTGIRICCANTMRMATGQGKRNNTLASGWELRHTVGIRDHLDAIRGLYARTTEAWQKTEESLRFLASKPVNDAALTRMFNDPWTEPGKTGVAVGDLSNAPATAIRLALEEAEAEANGEEAPSESKRAGIIRELREARLRTLLAGETCSRFQSTRDTLFAAYNAVTEYLEHEAPVKLGASAKDLSAEQRQRAGSMNRFASANFGGNNDKVKSRAFALAMELANA